MSDTVISVENLGKSYALRHKGDGARYATFRDIITRQVTAPVKAIAGKIRGLYSGSNGSSLHGFNGSIIDNSVERFWALKDISFEVKQGDVLGIIGRNGAGKSTLLKILSRITEPSQGRVRIKGRVASLLEVGTGFHPELTGRENIYLNGGILGMSRAETKAKFDEIVAFAGVEKFLDTPVKRYSSGMYMRLAFAVAAHLEPEILIVDEVLAVGDAEFQKKCLGKMHDVATGGRTVLFVSHNLDSILRLCRKVLWLDAGSVREMDHPASVIHNYSRHRSSESRSIFLFERQRPHWARQMAITRDITCLTEDGAVWAYPFGSSVNFACTVVVRSRISMLHFAYSIFSATGFEIASARQRVGASSHGFEPGEYKVRVHIPSLRLAPGDYSIQLGIKSESGEEDIVPEAALFDVIPNEESAGKFADTIYAACIPESRFGIESLDPTISLECAYSTL
jgi:lipopolysaccharide transport system ATP-binding protein